MADNGFEGLLNDPMFQFGAGILGANSGNYGKFGPALLGGMQTVYSGRKLQQEQAEALLKARLDAARLKVEQQRSDTEALKAKNEADQAGNPWQGTSVDAQAMSVLQRLEAKRARGETLTPDEEYQRAMAERHLTQPSLSSDPSSGALLSVAPPPLPRYGQAGGAPGLIGAGASGARTPTGGVVPITAPKPVLKPELTSEERKQQAQRRTALNMVDQLDALYQRGAFGRGGTGPISDVVNRAGLRWEVGDTKDKADAYALARKLEVEVLAAVRGAQVGPLEQERFSRQLPRPEQGDEEFQANIRATRDNLTQLYNLIDQQTRGGSGPLPKKPAAATYKPGATVQLRSGKRARIVGIRPDGGYEVEELP